MKEVEPTQKEDITIAAGRQRTDLVPCGIDHNRAEDPGRTRTQASRWLGGLIAARQRENGEKPDPPKVGNQLAGRAESWQGSAGSS